MNYLEHKTQVKYGDGLLAHSQEWQWLIDEIEECFEIKEITSWKQYLSECGPIREVFGYFVKILNVCNKTWTYSKKEFEEIWEIAKFYVGSVSVNDCIDRILHTQCKLLLFSIWITKLENGDNGSEYLYDVRLLTQRNYFELIKCDTLLEYEQELRDYANTIHIAGLDIPLKYLKDNLHQVQYPCDPKFLLLYKKEILNYNTFSFNHINSEECQTWQELYLLDMLRVSFNERKIQPMFSGEDISVPDISIWNERTLKSLKKYFNHIIADFVIESIEYVKFSIEPSKKVKLLHCRLLTEAIGSVEKSYKIFSSSSYRILSYLFQDRLMKECNREEEYINLIKSIQALEDPLQLVNYKNDGFPISKEQRFLVSEYLTNKYKQIDTVSTIYVLAEYLGEQAITNKITTEYLRKVSQKFEKYIGEETSIIVSSVFYKYMVFLIDINQKNSNIDKRYVQKEMIHIQKVWEKKIYKRQCEGLHKISHEQSIKKEELEKFCDIALLNPIIFAKNCTPSSEKAILDIMTDVSENPMSHLFSGVTLTSTFPIERNKVVYEKHDIDEILLQYVNNLRNKKGYKLLNQLKTEIFVSGIHDRYRWNTKNALSLFIKEEELYNTVKKETEIKLLPYSNTISLALITQLFPILEMKIREMVTYFGIFPFKENVNEFMQYNDPSSLLRELLKMIFAEQHSFENVPDLIYVYNIMYNGNSFNVRNECIHGRDYLSGGSFKFAFRATLFAIHMVEFRIKTIKDNVSDIIDISE